MNTLAQSLGLPTYPIADAMFLRKRSLAEYQWLIDRGFFSIWHQKHLIRKHNGVYQLLRNNAPEPELEAESATLDALIKDHDLPIAQFQWHVNWTEDNEPTYPLQASEEPTTGELEALAHMQELEPA